MRVTVWSVYFPFERCERELFSVWVMTEWDIEVMIEFGRRNCASVRF